VNSEAGRSAVAFQILAYPVTDARMNSPSYQEFAEATHLTASAMAWFWQHYIRDPAERRDPRASPLLAPSLAGAPPAFILTAENDPLRDEGEAYAAALRRDGVSVVCKRYAGQIHGFVTLIGMFDGGAAALADIAAFIDARLNARDQQVRPGS
jgi:acetyl esterase